MIVVSNSSPLISLVRLDLAHILPELFGEISIPPEVYDETAVVGKGRPAARLVAESDWIKTRPLSNRTVFDELRTGGSLGAGESAAIALAFETKADLTLLDDRAARFQAINRGLPMTGTLGLVEAAHRKGLIRDLNEVISRLPQAGVRISKSLLNDVLRRNGLSEL